MNNFFLNKIKFVSVSMKKKIAKALYILNMKLNNFEILYNLHGFKKKKASKS